MFFIRLYIAFLLNYFYYCAPFTYKIHAETIDKEYPMWL